MPSKKKIDIKALNAEIGKFSNDLFNDSDVAGPGKSLVENDAKKIYIKEEWTKLGLKVVDPDNNNPYFDETFKPVRDNLKLEEAIKEKNKTNIIDLFCRKSRAQRGELLTLCRSTNDKNFTKNLTSILKKNTLRTFDILTTDLLTAFAYSMKAAIDDKNYLLMLMLTRCCPKEELKEIGAIYKTLFKKQLEKEFEKFPKGINKLFTYYYEFEFEVILSPSQVETEVDKLIMNLKTKDTNFLATLFSRRQNDFLHSVSNLFFEKSEKTILQCFDDKMNTQAFECFSLLYDLVHDFTSAIVKFIGKQLNAYPDSMLDFIILRSEVDLGMIEKVYFEKNGRHLLESLENVLYDDKRIIAQYLLVPLTPL